MHVNARAVLTLQLFERRLGVRIHRENCGGDVGLAAARCESLDLANRHAAASDFAGDRETSLGIGDGKESARDRR